MSWVGTSLITAWFLWCPRMAANHQQSITRAPCHWGLGQPRWVSLGFCASFQLCEQPVLELGRGEAGGIQPCPTVAKQALSPPLSPPRPCALGSARERGVHPAGQPSRGTQPNPAALRLWMPLFPHSLQGGFHQEMLSSCLTDTPFFQAGLIYER